MLNQSHRIHITLHHINSYYQLRGHTHMHRDRQTHIHTRSISRNQVCGSHRLVWTWFINVTGPAKIDHVSAKHHRFLLCLLYHNLITNTTATQSSATHGKIKFIYFIISRDLCISKQYFRMSQSKTSPFFI